MYHSIEHWQPLAMGHSGVFPDEFFTLIEEMAAFPSRRALRYLQQRGVRYLIVHFGADPRRYADIAVTLGERHEVDVVHVGRTTREEIAIYDIYRPSAAARSGR